MTTRVARETIYGNVIYPEVLPRARGNMAEYSAFMLCTLTCAFVPALPVDNVLNTYGTFFLLLLCYVGVRIICVFLTRFTYYIEERRHLASRYNSDQIFLVKGLLEFSAPFKYIAVILILCSFFFVVLTMDVMYIISEHGTPLVPLVLIIGHFIMKYLELEKCAVHDSIVMESLQPLDYGSGMALNFFYGFLHLCLPNPGDQEKGLRERIDDFMGKHDLKDKDFPVKKLIILIPSSSYVPNDLKEKSYGFIEKAGSLEMQIKDRAGVIARVYKNSVYKIKDPESRDPPVYVVAEGATPCKTFHEVMQNSGVKQSFFQKHHKEIIFMFYERLREVLKEHPNCKDHCELIYYVDRDEHGLDNVNVAKIILQRLREIKETETYLRQIREAENL